MKKQLDSCPHHDHDKKMSELYARVGGISSVKALDELLKENGLPRNQRSKAEKVNILIDKCFE